MTKRDRTDAADWLAAVGEPTRIVILVTLARGPMNVTQLAKALGTSIVNVSHHLGVLRVAGVLSDEKDGRHVNYSLTDAPRQEHGSLVLTHATGVVVKLPVG